MSVEGSLGSKMRSEWLTTEFALVDEDGYGIVSEDVAVATICKLCPGIKEAKVRGGVGVIHTTHASIMLCNVDLQSETSSSTAVQNIQSRPGWDLWDILLTDRYTCKSQLLLCTRSFGQMTSWFKATSGMKHVVLMGRVSVGHFPR